MSSYEYHDDLIGSRGKISPEIISTLSNMQREFVTSVVEFGQMNKFIDGIIVIDPAYKDVASDEAYIRMYLNDKTSKRNNQEKIVKDLKRYLNQTRGVSKFPMALEFENVKSLIQNEKKTKHSISGIYEIMIERGDFRKNLIEYEFSLLLSKNTYSKSALA
jgi:hypothetical protein